MQLLDLFTTTEQPTMANFNKRIQDANINISGATRIASGSYVGTGTYGSENPCSLTLDFVPKLILIDTTYTGSLCGNPYTPIIMTSRVFKNSYTTLKIYKDASSYSELQVKVTGTTVYWYESNAVNQLNFSGITYDYIAIG